MNTTRRDALRKIGLAGSLIAIPDIAGALVGRAEAGVCALPAGEPDRALFEAIRDWRVINIAYLGLGNCRTARYVCPKRRGRALCGRTRQRCATSGHWVPAQQRTLKQFAI
jgi:hypothetical protein